MPYIVIEVIIYYEGCTHFDTVKTAELGAMRTQASIFGPFHAYKTLEYFCNGL